jgi:hypothetical protein
MKLKQLLLRGATGILLATGTVGVAVVMPTAPAQAQGMTCDQIAAAYEHRVGNALRDFGRAVQYKELGNLLMYERHMGFYESWMRAANALSLC